MGNSNTRLIQNQNAAANLLLSPILKLDVDCFEELFEWLPLADLLALRETCKRLQQIVDYFIRTNYPVVKFGFGRIKLYNIRNLNYFLQMDHVKVKMIKEVIVKADEITKEDIDIIKGILPQLEGLEIGAGNIRANFYESIIKWCSKLKYLSIRTTLNNGKKSDKESNWLLHHCPSIEHLKIIIYDDDDEDHSEIAELGTFLQLNPNVQTLSITSDLLQENLHCFLGSNIKIDRLNVRIYFWLDIMGGLGDTLNQLYEQGFHKRVHLFIYLINQEDVDKIASIRGLEKIYISKIKDMAFTLPPMPDLRELCFGSPSNLDHVDIDSVSKNLANIERINFEKCKAIAVLPFLRYSPKVKEIKVDKLKEGTYFKNGIIDLSALNKERKALAGTCKVTIYVEEDIFLSTKFAITKTEYNMVTLKRSKAVEWTHDLKY